MASAAAAAVAALGSTVIGTIGALQQGKAQSDAAHYNADVASNNALQAQRNATMAGEAGEAKAAMEERSTRAQVGQIKANQAASGVDVNSGSALDVQASASELGELDALTIRSNAAKEAYGYQVQGIGEQAKAGLDEEEAKNDITASYYNAGSTFLGGASNASSNFSKFQMAGGI